MADIDWKQVITKENRDSEKLLAERAVKNKLKQAAVDGIVVDVDGLKFDGDEVSQNRMRMVALALSNNEKISWIMADNTIELITRDQLLNAASKSALCMAKIWSDE